MNPRSRRRDRGYREIRGSGRGRDRGGEGVTRRGDRRDRRDGDRRGRRDNDRFDKRDRRENRRDHSTKNGDVRVFMNMGKQDGLGLHLLLGDASKLVSNEIVLTMFN